MKPFQEFFARILPWFLNLHISIWNTYYYHRGYNTQAIARIHTSRIYLNSVTNISFHFMLFRHSAFGIDATYTKYAIRIKELSCLFYLLYSAPLPRITLSPPFPTQSVILLCILCTSNLFDRSSTIIVASVFGLAHQSMCIRHFIRINSIRRVNFA